MRKRIRRGATTVRVPLRISMMLPSCSLSSLRIHNMSKNPCDTHTARIWPHAWPSLQSPQTEAQGPPPNSLQVLANQNTPCTKPSYTCITLGTGLATCERCLQNSCCPWAPKYGPRNSPLVILLYPSFVRVPQV